ncbi:hypothetical protein VIGAN_01183700 [Vigna angularis var. angularis]|uniref:Glycosyltransferases n=1 Tax=Vigna angularis var. angularis TaxID=157739 RepID=A0A0S3R0W0_PHAAN|nr:hypothetical protein VIGAN_01183700 [Vigna angularis var. angularis]
MCFGRVFHRNSDDDNIYSLDLFQRMREIRRFGTWTVARLSGDKSRIVLQGPICNGNRLIGWHSNEPIWEIQKISC